MILKYHIFIIIFLGIIQMGFSQKQSYVDSLSQTISEKQKKEQVNTILNIPYDKAVGDIDVYEKLINNALQLSEELNDSFMLAEVLVKKSLALHFTSKNEEALQQSLKAIRIYETLNEEIKVGAVYCDLAWKLKHRDFEKAFNYMQRGLKIREKNNDVTVDLYSAYDNYGVLHGMKKQWDSALYYHKKSLVFRKEIKDSVSIPFGYAHIANVYLNTNKYDVAELYLDSSLSIRKKRKDIYGITDSKLYLGDLFFAKKEYLKAINNFQEAYQLAYRNKYFPLKKYATEYLYKSYDSINNYKKALEYNLLYNKLKDSVSNIETNSRVAKLEIEYQTEKKEKEILSQRADLAESKLNLNKKNTQLIGLALLAIVLALLGYLFYNQQKLKNRQLQKENELKDALIKIETQNRLQEQRLSISRDLHDNIGAQLTFIISSIDNLKYGFKIPDKLSGKLKDISNFTIATIYELRDTIWAMNKNEITFEDLQSRISNFIDKAKVASHNSKFNFDVDKSLSNNLKFSSVSGMNLYRIIQESINNAIKYANASLIEVDIIRKDENLIITIQDNGKGFDINNADLGNGIHNMKKRAQELNANISIESTLNKGTSVKLKIPINT